MIKINKIGAAVVGLGLALALIAGVAAPVANAQAMSLSQLVDLFISLGIISPDKAAAAKSAVSSSASAAVSFTRDLTVGSSGADVTALQNAIGVSPATGYFGALTKAAVQKYQASKGVPATGYVGALTRAELNKGSAVATPAPTTSTVVNTGVEGTLTVNKSSVSNTTAYEGDSMRTVLAFKADAKVSDIAIQRVKLDLGDSTSIYTKVYRTMYLVDDAGRVLAQADLNSNTVVKDGGRYYLTLGGFSYVIPRNSSKVLSVKADLYSSIDSGDRGNRTVTLAAQGVRAVDGAGIDQYSPLASFSQTVAVSASLVDSATLDLSLNSANFKANEVVAYNGTANNELDQLPVLMFDLRANKDNVEVTDLAVGVTVSGGSATVPTVYLYDGSDLVASESLNGNVATFTDIDKLSIAKDATKTLTVKVDVRNATTTATTISATASSTSFSVENSVGDDVDVSGSASGENQIVRSVGPIFALNSKSMTVSGVNNSGSTLSTSTLTATFSVTVTAKGGDIYFANQASSSNKMFTFALYDASGAAAAAGVATTSEGFPIPSSGVSAIGTDGFKLSKNNTVVIDNIKVDVEGKNRVTGNPITGTAVGISSIRWSTEAGVAPTASTFMAGKTEWRTETRNP